MRKRELTNKNFTGDHPPWYLNLKDGCFSECSSNRPSSNRPSSKRACLTFLFHTLENNWTQTMNMTKKTMTTKYPIPENFAHRSSPDIHLYSRSTIKIKLALLAVMPGRCVVPCRCHRCCHRIATVAARSQRGQAKTHRHTWLCQNSGERAGKKYDFEMNS